MDKEFADKSDKLKESAKNFYKESGYRINVNKLRNLVSPVIYQDKNKGGNK